MFCNLGTILGAITIGITSILELTNVKIVRNILNNQGFLHYANAWVHATFNSLVLGPLTYRIIELTCIDKGGTHSFFTSILNFTGIVAIHSFGYYVAHLLMHQKKLFFMHKFHHTFSSWVTPVIAMAVSPCEYLFAYMLPFVLASKLICPSRMELVSSAGAISLCNIVIHCQSLEFLSEYYSEWVVSPNNHLTHHRRNATHFSAPTFNLDYFVEKAKYLICVNVKND